MNIILPKLQPYQKQVLDDVSNAKDQVFVVKSMRQCGKTVTLKCLIYQQIALHPKSTVIVVSLTYKNLLEIYNSIAADCEKIADTHGNNMSIEFINGSRVLFLSAATGENIRGYTCDLLLIDEACYVSDKFIDVCTPFVNARNGNIVMVSTPRFRQGRFYEYFTTPSKNIHVYDWSLIKNPYITEEKLELFRQTMPAQLFQAEYKGQWMEQSSDVFGDFSSVIGEPGVSHGNSAGIDWGSGQGQDYTVVSIFNDAYEMVALEYFNDLDATRSIERIAEVLKKHDVKKVTVEKNSIGKIYRDMLVKATSIPVYDFVTSNDSKCRIVENLISLIQKKQIRLLDDSELKTQFAAYELQPLSNGKHTYNAVSGFHDDIIMASAICIDSMKKGQYGWIGVS